MAPIPHPDLGAGYGRIGLSLASPDTMPLLLSDVQWGIYDLYWLLAFAVGGGVTRVAPLLSSLPGSWSLWGEAGLYAPLPTGSWLVPPSLGG
jgi:hypothetical protein